MYNEPIPQPITVMQVYGRTLKIHAPDPQSRRRFLAIANKFGGLDTWDYEPHAFSLIVGEGYDVDEVASFLMDGAQIEPVCSKPSPLFQIFVKRPNVDSRYINIEFATQKAKDWFISNCSEFGQIYTNDTGKTAGMSVLHTYDFNNVIKYIESYGR